MLNRCSIGFPTLHLAQNTFEPMFSYSDRLFFEGIDHNMLLYARRTSFDKIQDKWMNFSVRSLIIICMTFNILKYFATVCSHQYAREVLLFRKSLLAGCTRHVYIFPQEIVFTTNVVQVDVEVFCLPVLARLEFRLRESKVSWWWMFVPRIKLIQNHSLFIHAGLAPPECCCRAPAPAPGSLDFQTYM